MPIFPARRTIIAEKRGIPLGDIPTGSIIQINEDGVPANFRVAQHNYIQQGVTAVERVQGYLQRAFNSTQENKYENGALDVYLIETYRKLLEQNILNSLIPVNIPVTLGAGDNTVTTLSRDMFVFSGAELGISDINMNIEGSRVGIYTDDKSRIKYRDNSASAVVYWSRSIDISTSNRVWRIIQDGTIVSTNPAVTSYFTPVLTLPSTYRFPEYSPANLEDYTWSQIAEISESGRATSFFRLGDEKTFTLSTGEEITMQIVGFGHDDLWGGSGQKAGITFGMKNLLADTYPMNATSTNVGGWANTQMRTSTIQNIYAQQIPSDLREVIKQVSKPTTAGNQSTNITNVNGAIWLYSAKEVGLQTTVAGYMDEGETYPIFTDNSSRIKNLSNGAGTANAYWTRSPNTGNASGFSTITAVGNWSNSGATNPHGVCFGFCI